MKTRTLLLSAAAIILLAAVALAQATRASARTPSWAGKSVVLARVNGRMIAPACPQRPQIRHYTERGGKWERSALGCRYMLAGNFTRATVVDDGGEFLRVRYALTAGTPPKFLPQEDTFWTPRERYQLSEP